MQCLIFKYINQQKEEKTYEVMNWTEVGRYIYGLCMQSQRRKTFRKDRVVEYLNDTHLLLQDPHPPAPPTISRRQEVSVTPEILFTGFPAPHRAQLEQRATESGLRVKKSVTQQLTFLCGGPNAGPTKVESARAQGAYILSEEQFFALLETGELPDEEM